MEDKVMLVLYKDGTLSVFSHVDPAASHFQGGARFFECSDDLPVIELCEWFARNFNHLDIKELKPI